MKKLVILGSGDSNILDGIKIYFKGKDVEIFCVSDDEHSDFFKHAKDMDFNIKYLPEEVNFEYFSSLDFDLAALFDYRKNLSAEVLKTGKFINLHESLLPAFKGADALYRAFNSGVKVSGVTVYQMADDIMQERIIAQYPVLISNLMHFDEFKLSIKNLENILYPVVIEKTLEDKVFDFEDLLNNSGCSGGCSSSSGGCQGGCGGCH